MSAYLRHTPTGDIYPYTDALMKRGDMEPCTRDGAAVPLVDEPVAEPAPPKPARKARAKKEPAPPTVVDEPVAEPSDDGLDMGFDLDLDIGDD